jgi:hypothetical protein
MQQQVEVFFHSQQPYTSVQEADLAQYPSGRLDFPNRYFDGIVKLRKNRSQTPSP